MRTNRFRHSKCSICVIVVVALFAFPVTAKTPDALTCAGSTFAAPIYKKWIESFEAQVPGLRITYDAVGSEAGLGALRRKEVNFGATDYAAPEQTTETYLVPTVVGAAVPVYNLPQLREDLRFTPALLADIFLGKVKTWDDPAVRAVNRGARLPSEKIVLIHRSDGSGTSFLWTDFLSQASPEWRGKIGMSFKPAWPAGRGVQGNEGLANSIGSTPYSLGYVEYIYALRYRLSYGSMKNGAGRFVAPDIDSLTAAASASASKQDPGSIANAKGRDAYPIASFTWFVIPKAMESGEKRQRLQAFLLWMLKQGQKEVASLGYVPLPQELAQHESERVAHFWQQ